MINITKKVMIFSINIMIILCLFSCSVKEIFVDDNVVQETTQAYISNYYTMDVAPAMRMSAKVSNESFDMVQEDIEEVISNEKKIIKNYNISGETKTFDQSYQILLDEIKKLDGVVDNQSIDNQNISKDKKQKYLYMSVRIPVANADKFNKFLDNNINILSRSESQEDITDNYNDTKLRIETLKQEQTRLNELLNSSTALQIVQEIKDTWTKEFMQQTLTNTGSAQLLQKGLENFSYESRCELYLEEYNFIQSAGREDFIQIMNDIPGQAPLRFYAK